MTPAEIRAEHERLMEKLRKHQGKIKVTQQKLRNLYELCEHPQGRSYRDRDGSSSMSCPDCGGD